MKFSIPLIATFQTLVVIAFIKVGWLLAIFSEMFVVLLVLAEIYALFRRCPVCGQRSLTLDLNNIDSTTDIGQCRNCKSHISIQKKGYSRYIYYVKKRIWSNGKSCANLVSR